MINFRVKSQNYLQIVEITNIDVGRVAQSV